MGSNTSRDFVFLPVKTEEAIQLAYRRLVVLLRCLFMPEILHQGLFPSVKLESGHMTSSVFVGCIALPKKYG
jgi:hypothetical protein